MKCLNCGKDGVMHKNATDIGDGGGCTIRCTHCGQEHDCNLVRRPFEISFPLPWWQKAAIFVGLAVFLAVSYGIYKLVIPLLQ